MQRNSDNTFTMSKIDLIKFLRASTNLSLMDAKNKMEAYVLGESLSPEQRHILTQMRGMIDRTNGDFSSRPLSPKQARILLGIEE